jgi:hypothetical protein
MEATTEGMGSAYFSPPESITRLGRIGLVVGVLGVVSSAVGAFVSPERFYSSYLVAYIWMAALPVGSLALLMLQHVAGGRWGYLIRRVLEASTRTLPLVVLLFVPVILGLKHIYPWADPVKVAHDEVIAAKAHFLNPVGFVLRAALFFGIWIVLGSILDRMSARQDVSADPRRDHRMGMISAPGLIIWCLAGTFASVDWLMSLDPHWYSSLYGVYFFESMALAALAFTVFIAVVLSRSSTLESIFTKRDFHDYGNLLLAFIMLWGYFAFSQFLIIWSGDLPEEVPWYLERTTSQWKVFTMVLILLQFVVPFLLLLTHAVKGRPGRLVFVAVLLIAVRYADYFWQVMPPLHQTAPLWLDFATIAGLGGIWLAAFCWQLRRRTLFAVNDPRFQELISRD